MYLREIFIYQTINMSTETLASSIFLWNTVVEDLSTIACLQADTEHKFCTENGPDSDTSPFAVLTSPPVFLDENNIVKLGDSSLLKALAQASFANTYVGARTSKSLPSCRS